MEGQSQTSVKKIAGIRLRLAIKRGIDILFALFGLVISTPLLALFMVLIRLTIRMPAIYRQVRPGLDEEPFTIYKLRTMKDIRDADGNLLPDEERVTRLGYFLRSTSLDELPELINVLKGDMSIVGPRPLLMEYLDRYLFKGICC